MRTSLSNIKNWFKTGLIPTQQQFWDTWDSFWHKDDAIPIESIQGINEVFTPINDHLSDQDLHYTFVLTSGDLTKAKKNDNFLFGILDKYTGEDVTLIELNSEPPEIDNIIYFNVDGVFYKRVFDYAKPEWFGLNGETDEVAINNALLSSDVVILEQGKMYYTSNPIKLKKNKILIGNHATINSTSSTTIIEGINELLSNVYQHYRVSVTNLKLVSGTAVTGINMMGFKHSVFENIRIEITNTNANSKGVYLKHGDQGYKQCYFNDLVNCEIYLDNSGVGILIEGTEGISGANCNTVKGCVVTGYDSYGVVIRNSSVGNTIERVNCEAFEQKNEELDHVGFLVQNSTQNTFIACHCETYRTAFKCDSSSFGNRFIGGSFANNIDVSIDLGENVWAQSNKLGNISYSQGTTNEGLEGNGFRIQNYVNANIRLDTKNPFTNSRNISLVNEIGNFVIKRSNAVGGNPLTDGTVIFEIMDNGFTNFKYTFKITDLIQYPDNAAALADGWTAGYIYKDASGNLKVVI